MSQNTRGDDLTPRHGRHAAHDGSPRAPRRVAGARPGSHFAGATTSNYQHYARTNTFESDEIGEQDAPRPVLDPATTGSFQRIEAGMGATVENRSNVSRISPSSTASWSNMGGAAGNRLQGRNRPQVESRAPKAKTNVKVFAVIGVGAAIVVAVVLLVAGTLLRPSNKSQGSTVVEQTQTDASQAISYRGISYKLEAQQDGKYALVGYAEGAKDGTVYFTFEGTPVQLVLYNGALIIPENLGDSWDVLGYTMGAGALPTQVVNAEGEAITGKGKIAHVELASPNLIITDEAGAKVTVPLS